MATSAWSRRSFILIAALFALGGFLMGKSSSEDKENPRGAEGRFQLIATPDRVFVVFDTRTARGWAWVGHSTVPRADLGRWLKISSPFDGPIVDPVQEAAEQKQAAEEKAKEKAEDAREEE
jgi:hypothetical protein